MFVRFLNRIVCAVALAFAAQSGFAAVIQAQPSNYRALLRTLKSGDTLALAPGTYPPLYISNLNGTESAWITIAGPESGRPAVILGEPGYNTVEIVNCSYVALESLRIDSRGIPGSFGISARGRDENRTHHIRIEGNVLVGQGGGQQTVGISTKTPTWGWVIRNNQILGAGTGIYLGDSDGSEPFVAGVIENNLIKDTIGYNLQIKHQTALPNIPGMPLEPTTTIIRNNVFIKDGRPSPDGDRPNVILGGFPATGAGSLNMYEVYGNFFFYNHREALFQASGRVSVHDNLFVDGPYSYPAVVFRNHEHPLKVAHVYNNTVYTSERGIHFANNAAADDAVVGNAVFAARPITGPIMRQADNLTDFLDGAGKHVTRPSFKIEELDLHPLAGKCQGAAIDLSAFHTDTDYTLDFNGTPKTQAKGTATFRGAYAGDGPNPGWRLAATIKIPSPPRLNPVPILVWITPPTLQAGIAKEVTLTGANFKPETTLTAGPGISVSNVKVVSPTQMTATVTTNTSVVGARDLMVRTAAGTSNTLTVRVVPRQR